MFDLHKWPFEPHQVGLCASEYYPSSSAYQHFRFYKKVHNQHYVQRENEDVETGLCNIPVRLNLEEMHFGNR